MLRIERAELPLAISFRAETALAETPLQVMIPEKDLLEGKAGAAARWRFRF